MIRYGASVRVIVSSKGSSKKIVYSYNKCLKTPLYVCKAFLNGYASLNAANARSRKKLFGLWQGPARKAG